MSKTLSDRLIFVLIGAAYGLAAYAMVEYLDEVISNKRAVLFIVTAFAGFFGVSLSMLGRVHWPKVFLPAAGLGLLTALLLVWSSFRFEAIEKFDNSPLPFLASFLILAISTPFLIVRLGERQGWFDYEGLFKEAWALAVRGILAAAFTALTFGVLWLSAYLLKLVKLNFLEQLLEEPWFFAPLSGAIFGLALAVIAEMNSVVETLRSLVVHLLRLLLPLVVVVSAVFLVMVPIQGLESVFQRLSAAGTVMAVALAGVAFVTATLDASDETSSVSSVLHLAARAMCILLPFLAGLALYAIWLRVAQYGWTPQRLAATTAAVLITGYALAYAAFAIVARLAWRDRLRQTNIWLAGASVLVAILWLSPVLNAQKISANSQVGRYLDGQLEAKNVGLWELKRKWGIAGERGLDRLTGSQEAKADPQMVAALERLDSAKHSGDLRLNTDISEALDQLQKTAIIVPKGTKLPDELNHHHFLKEIASECKIEGDLPNCAFVFADLDPQTDGDEIVAIYQQGQSINLVAFANVHKNAFTQVHWNSLNNVGDQFFADIAAGKFELRPTGEQTLSLGGRDLIFNRF